MGNEVLLLYPPLYLPPEDDVEHLDTGRIGWGKFVGQLDRDPNRSVVGLPTGCVRRYLKTISASGSEKFGAAAGTNYYRFLTIDVHYRLIQTLQITDQRT